MALLREFLNSLTKQVTTDIFVNMIFLGVGIVLTVGSWRSPKNFIPPIKPHPLVAQLHLNEEAPELPNPFFQFLAEEINVSSIIPEAEGAEVEGDEFSDGTDTDVDIPEPSSRSYSPLETEPPEEIIQSKKDLVRARLEECANLDSALSQVLRRLIEYRPIIQILYQNPSVEDRDAVWLFLENLVTFYLFYSDKKTWLSLGNLGAASRRINQNLEKIETKLELLDTKRILLYSNIRRFSPEEIRLILSRIETSQQKLLVQKELEEDYFAIVKENCDLFGKGIILELIRITVTETSGEELVRQVYQLFWGEASTQFKLIEESIDLLTHEIADLRRKAPYFRRLPVRARSLSTLITSRARSSRLTLSLTAGLLRRNDFIVQDGIRTNPRVSPLRLEAGGASREDAMGEDPSPFRWLSNSNNAIYDDDPSVLTSGESFQQRFIEAGESSGTGE